MNIAHMNMTSTLEVAPWPSKEICSPFRYSLSWEVHMNSGTLSPPPWCQPSFPQEWVTGDNRTTLKSGSQPRTSRMQNRRRSRIYRFERVACCAFSGLPHAPPRPGTHPDARHEHPGEMALIREATGERDVGDRTFGFEQELRGLGDSLCEQPAVRRRASGPLEASSEVTAGESAFSRQLGDGQSAIEMSTHDVLGPPLQPRREPAANSAFGRRITWHACPSCCSGK